jgi:sulfatase modifying factor 1
VRSPGGHTVRPARGVVAVLGFTAAACLSGSSQVAPATAQVVLYVDTDAPVDDGVLGLPAIGQPLALFDRLRFDVTPPDPTAACTFCVNEFDVTNDSFSSHSASIGIPLPPGQAGWTVRVRLFPLALALPDGEPNPDASIDVTFALPALGAEGVVEATAFLSTGGTGQPAGQDTPMALAGGPPGPSAVGTWPGAQLTDCNGPPPAGMVCVPGGAFWMGSSADDFALGTTAGWRRLVVLSPFFLDSTEATAKSTRDLNQQAPIAWSGNVTGTSAADWCTYTDSPGPRDSLPANCMSKEEARLYCQSRGGDVPTEAQLEYAMGGLLSRAFVWGIETPACGDAVWGRLGYGIFTQFAPKTCLAEAKALGPFLGGPDLPRSGRRDVLHLPGGAIYDLIGNVSEWARDSYQLQSEPCWSPPGVLQDPQCQQASPSLQALNEVRGGSWQDGGTELVAAVRSVQAVNSASPFVGYRCFAAGQ